MTLIYVMRAAYPNTGPKIFNFTDSSALADAVLDAQDEGAGVEVFMCVPMKFRAYRTSADIELIPTK